MLYGYDDRSICQSNLQMVWAARPMVMLIGLQSFSLIIGFALMTQPPPLGEDLECRASQKVRCCVLVLSAWPVEDFGRLAHGWRSIDIEPQPSDTDGIRSVTDAARLLSYNPETPS